MLPTPTLELQLRSYLDAAIPDGGTDADTPFTADEIDALLTDADTVDAAAAAGWRLRAARAQSETDGLQQFSLDQQAFRFESLKDRREHALAMATQFAAAVVVTTDETPAEIVAAVRPTLFSVAPGYRGRW